MRSCFLGKYRVVGCLGYMVGVCVTSKETSKPLSKVVLPFSIPMSTVLFVSFLETVCILKFHAGVDLSLCQFLQFGDGVLNLGHFLELHLSFPL